LDLKLQPTQTDRGSDGKSQRRLILHQKVRRVGNLYEFNPYLIPDRTRIGFNLSKESAQPNEVLTSQGEFSSKDLLNTTLSHPFKALYNEGGGSGTRLGQGVIKPPEP
jgi:hypothetical protein